MKRGQAALEFLMTYGWAILVVLAAIAALAYFGVFNVKSLAPNSCTLPAGFTCKAYTTTSATTFNVFNGAGEDVTAVSITTATGSCITSSADISDNSQANLTNATCAIGTTAGAKVKTALTFSYTDSAGFAHNLPGSLVTTVE